MCNIMLLFITKYVASLIFGLAACSKMSGTRWKVKLVPMFGMKVKYENEFIFKYDMYLHKGYVVKMWLLTHQDSPVPLYLF